MNLPCLCPAAMQSLVWDLQCAPTLFHVQGVRLDRARTATEGWTNAPARVAMPIVLKPLARNGSHRPPDTLPEQPPHVSSSRGRRPKLPSCSSRGASPYRGRARCRTAKGRSPFRRLRCALYPITHLQARGWPAVASRRSPALGVYLTFQGRPPSVAPDALVSM